MKSLPPGFNVADELERDRIVRRVKNVVRGIQLDLNTIAHWNRTHPDQPPIDYPDEGGALAKAFADCGIDFNAMRVRAGLRPTTEDGANG